MKVPSHRYVRLRHFAGTSAEQIVREVELLSLPGYGIELLACVRNLVEGAPTLKEPDLKVVEGGKSPRSKKKLAKKRKPAAPTSLKDMDRLFPFLQDEGKGKWMSPDEYAKRWGLSALNSRSGLKRVEAALALWANPVSREIACAYLSCHADTKSAAAKINEVCPKLMSTKVRPIEVQTFQDLFWDFSNFSHSELRFFLQNHLSTRLTYAAFTEGLPSFLWRIHQHDLNASSVERVKNLQDISYQKLSRLRTDPDAMDVRETSAWWRIFSESVLMEAKVPETGVSWGGSWDAEPRDETYDPDSSELAYDGTETKQLPPGVSHRDRVQDMGEEEEYGIKISRQKPIPTYADILADQDRLRRLDEIDTAYRDGGISEEEAADLKEKVNNGVDIGDAARQHIKALRARGDEDDDLHTA